MFHEWLQTSIQVLLFCGVTANANIRSIFIILWYKNNYPRQMILYFLFWCKHHYRHRMKCLFFPWYVRLVIIMSHLMKQNIANILHAWLSMRIPIKTVFSLSSPNCSIYRTKLLELSKDPPNEPQPQCSVLLEVCWNYIVYDDQWLPAPTKEKLWLAFHRYKLSENFSVVQLTLLIGKA